MRARRLTRADWNGYAVLMIIGGAAGVVGVMLPWANEYTADNVNFSLRKPTEIAGVLSTQWGPPVLAVAIMIVVLAAASLALGPRRLTMAASALVVAAGVVFVVEAIGANDSLGFLYRPGLGLYVTLLAGILLVPIGLVSVSVAQFLRRHDEATGPPVP